MKRILNTILIGLIAITLFDILGSIASRQMNFSYSYLSVYFGETSPRISIDALSNLKNLYRDADVHGKRELLG